MKLLRQLLFFILALIVATAALSFFMPTSQKITKSISINAPAERIYSELKQLSNFNRVSVWSQQDSTIKYVLTGEDGIVGATISWKGAPDISGEGKIEITSLQPHHTVAHTIHFSQPQKGSAKSTFSIIEKDKNSTTVTWYFQLATPRPWNIFNLFFSLDKQMGKDFDAGLAALKLYIEASQLPVP